MLLGMLHHPIRSLGALSGPRDGNCESTINPIFFGKVSLELPDSGLPQVGLPNQANVE